VSVRMVMADVRERREGHVGSVEFAAVRIMA
jgi:hypothetical protein